MKNRLFAIPFARRVATLLPFIAAGYCLIGLSCIKRDNRFDPLLDHKDGITKPVPACSMDTLHSRQPSINALLVHTDTLAEKAKSFLQNFEIASRTVRDGNGGIEYGNGVIFEENQTVETNNGNQTVLGQLAFKTMFDTLSFLDPPQMADIIALTTSLTPDSIYLWRIFNALDSSCPDYADSVGRLRDSSMAAFSRGAEPIRSLVTSIPGIVKLTDSSNAAILEYNTAVDRENDRVRAYNDSINKVIWMDRMKNFPVISSGDSLRRHMQPGDSFIVEGALELNDNLKLSFRGTSVNHIALIGNPLTKNSVTMKTGSFFLDSAEYIDISNLTIRGSSESGVRVLNYSNNITLNNCDIEGNQGCGLAAFTSGITVVNCRIYNNGGGGIQFDPSPTDFQMNLNNVLIVKNYGVGVDLTNPLADLKFVTISHNGSDGIAVSSPTGSSLSIFNSIVSFNSRFGISRKDDQTGGTLLFGSIDFYGNASANFASDIQGTFNSVDPHFSDTLHNDYSIAPAGDIYTFETKQSIIIGYRPR